MKSAGHTRPTSMNMPKLYIRIINYIVALVLKIMYKSHEIIKSI